MDFKNNKKVRVRLAYDYDDVDAELENLSKTFNSLMDPLISMHDISELAEKVGKDKVDIRTYFDAMRYSQDFKNYLKKEGISISYSSDESCLMVLRDSYSEIDLPKPSATQLAQIRKALID